ncbi:hypothetical protein ACJX0J_028276, partial [Zea mays]
TSFLGILEVLMFFTETPLLCGRLTLSSLFLIIIFFLYFTATLLGQDWFQINTGCWIKCAPRTHGFIYIFFEVVN